jgi:glutamyl-tRNA synthetase
VPIYISENPQISSTDPGFIELVIERVKERATFPSDLWGLSHYFFKAPTKYNEGAIKKAWKDHSKKLMVQLIEVLNNTDDSSVDTLQGAVKGWITENEIGFGKVMMPLRVALVGALEGVDVFDIIFLIGKTEAIKRIQSLIDSK